MILCPEERGAVRQDAIVRAEAAEPVEPLEVWRGLEANCRPPPKYSPTHSGVFGNLYGKMFLWHNFYPIGTNLTAKHSSSNGLQYAPARFFK